jgi:hypothetical protein
MNLSLVMQAGAANQPVAPVKQNNLPATLRKRERSAAAQQASPKYRDAPILHKGSLRSHRDHLRKLLTHIAMGLPWTAGLAISFSKQPGEEI